MAKKARKLEDILEDILAALKRHNHLYELDLQARAMSVPPEDDSK